jgi:hypothetical protein
VAHIPEILVFRHTMNAPRAVFQYFGMVLYQSTAFSRVAKLLRKEKGLQPLPAFFAARNR